MTSVEVSPLRGYLGIATVSVFAVAVIAYLAVTTDPGQLSEPGQAASPPPVLSQFVSSNGSTIADEDGDFSDWIEVHNPHDEPVDLGGYFLSDDDEDPSMWRFPERMLEPDEYLVVFASGKDRVTDAGELHTNFRIDSSGEPVLLVGPDGRQIVDRFDPVELPRDAAFGRDGSDPDRTCFFAVASPGAPNDATCFDDARLGAPLLSVRSGFYDEPFELELLPSDDTPPDSTLYYTLDGSYPDPVSNAAATMVYEGPLQVEDRTPEEPVISLFATAIDAETLESRQPPEPTWDVPDPGMQKNTVVRARLEDGAESTGVYFVGPDLRRPEVPVTHLSTDPALLFDHDDGIYVPGRTFEDYLTSDRFDPEQGVWWMPANYHQRGRDWERPFADELERAVVMHHFDPGGGLVHERNVGVRIHGGATRAYRQKTLRLYARNDYGDPVLQHAFFGDAAPDQHRRLLLRNSGNDASRLMFLDAYLQEVAGPLEPDTQAYQPTILYINGEYWGIHNLRERYDRHYLAAAHEADPDQVVMLGNRQEVEEGQPGDDEHFRDVLQHLADNDPTDDAVIAEVERSIDLDNLLDFVAIHVFAGNWDWPGNNVRLWREIDGPDEMGAGVRDGRWRWLVFDLDHMGERSGRFNVDYDVLSDKLSPSDDLNRASGYPFLFDRLTQNDAVRDRFLTRFADHLNTSFSPSRSVPMLDDIVALLEDEIVLHQERWRDGTVDRDDWYGWIEQLRTFMQERPDRQREHLMERFGIDTTVEVTVASDPEAGYVTLNTIDLVGTTPGVEDPARWSGTYFAGVPVTLEATPADGYRFVGWSGLPGGDETSDVVQIVPDRDLTVQARFEPA